MDVPLSQYQIDLIKKIAKEEGLNDYEIKTIEGSLKGDNYMGIITAITLQNDTRRLELILKAAPDNEKLRNRIPVRKTFIREIYIYETVFSKFEQFQKDQGHLDGFCAYAKLYATSEVDFKECLIFENLKAKGYELWNRKIPMTVDHVSLVLKEYGKLHAVSFALKEKQPEDFEVFSKILSNISLDIDPEENSATIKGAIRNGFSAVRGDQFATKAFERFTLEVEKFLLEDLRKVEEKSVILHSDCWCNNMLFKYEDSSKKKPSKVCLIDWQISWIASPALDLLYFLLTCTSKEILSNYKYYLKVYHDSLKTSLERLNCDPDALFPFILLENHWKKYFKFGIYLALNLLRLCLSEDDEVVDMLELADQGDSLEDDLTFELAQSDIYNQRILDIVRLAAENNWI